MPGHSLRADGDDRHPLRQPLPPDGKAEELQLGPGHEEREIPFGSFQVHAGTGGVCLFCFSFRRSRTEPACRYFEIDTLIGGSGRIRRQRQLLDWFAAGRSAPEPWIERTQ